MPERSSTPKPTSKKTGPRDTNQTARSIVDAATSGETTMANPPPGAIDPREDPKPARPIFELADDQPSDGKNPAAVALGRLGGAKGGPARAAKLSDRKRKQIAKKAAAARWAKKP